MANIIFKKKHEPSQLMKNLQVVLFNIFAGFFNWFIIVICLTILIVGYWWLIKPKYDFISSDQELTFREREYEDKVTYLKQLNEVKNLYKGISQADKDKIDIMLSANQDIDRLKIILLREIGQVGKQQKIGVSNIAITPLDNSKEKLIKIAQEPKPSPMLEKLKLVQVTFLAEQIDYAGLKRMLTELEKSLRLMDITKVNFDPSARKASVELVTYYLEH
jgi:hypothetical protein